MEEPEDLEIEMGSEDMVFWKDEIEGLEKQLEALKKSIENNRKYFEAAQNMLKLATEEFNSEAS